MKLLVFLQEDRFSKHWEISDRGWQATALLPNSEIMKSVTPKFNDKDMTLCVQYQVPQYSSHYVTLN